MCDLCADIPSTLRRHGFPAGSLGAEVVALDPLVADELARADCGVIKVPEAARALVRRVASAFDAYLNPEEGRHTVVV
jgi:oxygen-independent coproporphyrinogen III oxidase